MFPDGTGPWVRPLEQGAGFLGFDYPPVEKEVALIWPRLSAADQLRMIVLSSRVSGICDMSSLPAGYGREQWERAKSSVLEFQGYEISPDDRVVLVERRKSYRSLHETLEARDRGHESDAIQPVRAVSVAPSRLVDFYGKSHPWQRFVNAAAGAFAEHVGEDGLPTLAIRTHVVDPAFDVSEYPVAADGSRLMRVGGCVPEDFSLPSRFEHALAGLGIYEFSSFHGGRRMGLGPYEGRHVREAQAERSSSAAACHRGPAPAVRRDEDRLRALRELALRNQRQRF